MSAKYGVDRVAQIATFNRMTTRCVLKDVGRVMGMTIKLTSEMASKVTWPAHVACSRGLLTWHADVAC